MVHILISGEISYENRWSIELYPDILWVPKVRNNEITQSIEWSVFAVCCIAILQIVAVVRWQIISVDSKLIFYRNDRQSISPFSLVLRSSFVYYSFCTLSFSKMLSLITNRLDLYMMNGFGGLHFGFMCAEWPWWQMAVVICALKMLETVVREFVKLNEVRWTANDSDFEHK